jgi:hypothetical protein
MHVADACQCLLCDEVIEHIMTVSNWVTAVYRAQYALLALLERASAH